MKFYEGELTTRFLSYNKGEYLNFTKRGRINFSGALLIHSGLSDLDTVIVGYDNKTRKVCIKQSSDSSLGAVTIRQNKSGKNIKTQPRTASISAVNIIKFFNWNIKHYHQIEAESGDYEINFTLPEEFVSEVPENTTDDVVAKFLDDEKINHKMPKKNIEKKAKLPVKPKSIDIPKTEPHDGKFIRIKSFSGIVISEKLKNSLYITNDTKFKIGYNPMDRQYIIQIDESGMYTFQKKRDYYSIFCPSTSNWRKIMELPKDTRTIPVIVNNDNRSFSFVIKDEDILRED